ncbi:MAG: FG-GAP-like repeat-containing protein [Candidatus Brocadiia bacterium]
MKHLALLMSALLLAGCAAKPAPVAQKPKPLSPAEMKIKAITDLYKQNKLDQAQTACEELLKAEPSNAAAHYERGNIWQYRDNDDMALVEFRKAIELDPSFYDAQRDIWYMELAKAADDNAKAELKSRIKEKAAAIISKGRPSDKLYSFGFYAYNMSGEPEKAEQMKTSLVSGYPDSEELDGVGNEVFENILAATQGANRPKRAPMCESYIKDFPNGSRTDYAYRFLLGFYWKDQPDAGKVKTYARMWVAARPQYPLALSTSARVCAEMGVELDQAAKWATAAVKYMDQSFPSLDEWTKRSDKKPFWLYEWQFADEAKPFDILDAAAWVYFKKGDFAWADSYMSQALKYENFHSRLWYHQGKIFQAQGKTDLALDALARSLIARNDIPEVPTAIKELLKAKHPNLSDAEIDQRYQGLGKEMAAKHGLPYFTDITAEAGLSASLGRKVAWGDYDNDGLQDLLINGFVLWHNNGDGTFTNVTTAAKLSGENTGGVWADYNNDGWLDFFSSGGADSLWKNNGDGTFTNVTEAVNPRLNDGHPTEGTGWGDYDRDGYVDLYAANYENPFSVGTPDFLYKNEKGLTFKDVTAEAGITPPKNMCGRGVNWGDYNNDGWPDIFVSNYRLNPDFLWKNNGNGTFLNVARETGVEGTPVQGAYGHTIGSEWADYNNDGNLDLFQANLSHPRYITFSNMSYLLRNNGAPDYRFDERRAQAGIRYEETHTEPAWGDFDNDGLLDLFITSVYVNMPSFLYKQVSPGQFEDITWLTGVRISDGYGCAWADFDNDGDLDLIAGENANKIHFFRNETISKAATNNNNWLEVKLIGADCNTAAIGARLTLKVTTIPRVPILSEIPILSAPPSAEQLTREVQGGKGTTSQHSLVQHFGLGNRAGPQALSVRWPCGRVTEHLVEPNKITTIKEP